MGKDFLSLSDEEVKRAEELAGKRLNRLELWMVDGMWNEHCSYKSSKVHIKKLPRSGSRVLVSEGENAGAVEVGDLAVVFKIESHNHPSAVEPFHGAATGVGGILRDVFAMGARPICLLDPLYFGDQEDPRNRFIKDNVVGGISWYGNCIGIPTVGGELWVHSGYSRTPLVNVMAVGVARKEMLKSSAARSPGDLVVLLGAPTGRDGIKGSSFASEVLEGELEDSRPAVQVGDPFFGKLLMEATLEIVEKVEVTAVQDLGASGLTSSCSEMAAKGGVGVEIHADRVHLREDNMSPEEIMLSETQERMLFAVPEEHLNSFKKIAEKWGVPYSVIGRFTEDRRFRVFFEENLVADLPVSMLVDGAPTYEREAKRRKGGTVRFSKEFDISFSFAEVLRAYERYFKNRGSVEEVFSQYDHTIGTNTVVPPSKDGAVLRLKGRDSMLAVSVDGNPFWTSTDPYEGGKMVVAEALRNVVVRGGMPLGITNCLNFGSPENPEVMGDFAAVVEGIRDACVDFEVPVLSGNVSFYNDSPSGPVPPTPVVGCVGEVVRGEYVPPLPRGRATLFLLGWVSGDLGGSLFSYIMKLGEDYLPDFNCLRAKAVNDLFLEMVRRKLVLAATDVSAGGLARALLYYVLHGETGFTVNTRSSLPWYRFYFSESGNMILFFSPYGREDEVLDTARAFEEVRGEKVELEPVGTTIEERKCTVYHNGEPLLRVQCGMLL